MAIGASQLETFGRRPDSRGLLPRSYRKATFAEGRGSPSLSDRGDLGSVVTSPRSRGRSPSGGVRVEAASGSRLSRSGRWQLSRHRTSGRWSGSRPQRGAVCSRSLNESQLITCHPTLPRRCDIAGRGRFASAFRSVDHLNSPGDMPLGFGTERFRSGSTFERPARSTRARVEKRQKGLLDETFSESPLTNSNRRPPSFPGSDSQPVATRVAGFGYSGFWTRRVCHYSPLVARAWLDKRSTRIAPKPRVRAEVGASDSSDRDGPPD